MTNQKEQTNLPKPGIYKHFKGGNVKLKYIATHSETLEQFAVYECLYECRTHGKGSIWIRPLDMFTETITRDGKTMKRFEYLSN